MRNIKNIKCYFGIHDDEIIQSQQTKEIEDVSGCHLRRNIVKCKICGKINTIRMDNIIIDDRNFSYIDVK